MIKDGMRSERLPAREAARGLIKNHGPHRAMLLAGSSAMHANTMDSAIYWRAVLKHLSKLTVN